jgi:pimeloyl-ACP methyl ester carboxylesterase
MGNSSYFSQFAGSIAAWRHEYIQTNHVQLHCVVQGQGPLVIFLHDFLEFWYSWRHQIPALARWFKVVVPDLRGYNDSEKPSGGYDLETLSRDVQGLIEALGYSQAIVVGHGWGGTIACRVAQQFPQSLRSLILMASPHPQRLVQDLTGNLDQFRRSWYVFAAQLPGVNEWLGAQNFPALVSNLFQTQAVRKGAFSAEVAQIYQAALAKPGVLTAALNYYRQFVSPTTLWRSLNRPSDPIQLPTLVLWGEDDTIFSSSLTQGFETLIQAPLKCISIPDCGHWLQQEAPHTVNRELLSFLRQEALIA